MLDESTNTSNKSEEEKETNTLLNIVYDRQKEETDEYNKALETWDKWNNTSKKISFSKLYFDEYSFNQYLNKDCKQTLQLGASCGELLCALKEYGSVKGYDVSPAAIKTLTSKEIDSYQINLNFLDEKGELTYRQQLVEDLAAPTHIFAIRVLSYMSPAAFKCLLFNMIDLTKPGSVIFIVEEVKKSSGKKSENTGTNQGVRIYKNYIASFFAPRRDIEFLAHHYPTLKKFETMEALQKIDPSESKEVLVIRKLGC